MKVTADMIERGAMGLHQHYRASRPSVHGPNRALTREQRSRDWAGVAVKDWYRGKAAAVLLAALDEEPQRNGTE